MLPTRDGVGEVQAQLNGYIQSLPIKTRAVVVVGSRARNSHWTDSDIDLVIVSDEFEGSRRGDRIELLLGPYRDLPSLEPMGFTPAEVLAAEDLYLWDALVDGRAVLDDGFWEGARSRFQRRVEGGELQRTERGWKKPGSRTISDLAV